MKAGYQMLDYKNMSMNELIKHKDYLQNCLNCINEILYKDAPLEKKYKGEATERQIDFVKGLLESSNVRLSKPLEKLTKFDCHCIIEVIRNDNQNAEIDNRFNEICYIDLASLVSS
jgi:hypothetical protein